MIWRALAAWGISSLNGGGGAPGRDLRSIPSIHWGDFLNNSADPLNFGGGSGSNPLANATNPAGFGAGPSWLTPNNNPDPSAQPGYGQQAAPPNPLTAGLTGGGTMGGGIDPTQQAALYAAYNNYLRAIGQPPMATAPAPAPNPGGGNSDASNPLVAMQAMNAFRGGGGGGRNMRSPWTQ